MRLRTYWTLEIESDDYEQSNELINNIKHHIAVLSSASKAKCTVLNGTHPLYIDQRLRQIKQEGE